MEKKYGLKDELKSTVIKRKKYMYGLHSMKKIDIDFYNDFMDLLYKYRDSIYTNYGVVSKIEYLVRQFVVTTDKNVNLNAFYYVITKLLCVYHPQKVFESLIKKNNTIKEDIKNFLKKRRELNIRINGQSEDEALTAVYDKLDSIRSNIIIDWNYHCSFYGFKKYLFENDINEYFLYIDKEGNGKTINSAKDVNLKNVREVDSKDYEGIRCADLLSGLINNFINSFNNELYYLEDEVGQNKKLLSEKWFQISEEEFLLYKKFFNVIIGINPCFFKVSSYNYADGIIYFNSFLNYFNSYESFFEYSSKDFKIHQNELNFFANNDLVYFFEKSIENNQIFIEYEDSCYQLLYDYKNINYNNNINYHKTLKLPIKNQEVSYLILDFIEKYEMNDKKRRKIKRYIKISDKGKDLFFMCPERLYLTIIMEN